MEDLHLEKLGAVMHTCNLSAGKQENGYLMPCLDC